MAGAGRGRPLPRAPGRLRLFRRPAAGSAVRVPIRATGTGLGAGPLALGHDDGRGGGGPGGAAAPVGRGAPRGARGGDRHGSHARARLVPGWGGALVARDAGAPRPCLPRAHRPSLRRRCARRPLPARGGGVGGGAGRGRHRAPGGRDRRPDAPGHARRRARCGNGVRERRGPGAAATGSAGGADGRRPDCRPAGRRVPHRRVPRRASGDDHPGSAGGGAPPRGDRRAHLARRSPRRAPGHHPPGDLPERDRREGRAAPEGGEGRPGRNR